MASRLASMLAALAVAGCSTEPYTLPAQFDAGAATPEHKALVSGKAGVPGCALQLASLKDLRADPASLGRFGGREIQAADFAAWLRAGIEERLALQHPGTPPVAIEAEVVQAYVHGIAVSKSVDIVARVRYVRDGQLLRERTFRGGATRVNWNSSDTDAREGFELALNSLLDQLITEADAAGYCQGPPEVVVTPVAS